MPPPAPLGVTVEESKAQRVQRQQARFRDRGGVFVPAATNPLVDILLARTVAGESPSKKNVKNGRGARKPKAKAKAKTKAKARDPSPSFPPPRTGSRKSGHDVVETRGSGDAHGIRESLASGSSRGNGGKAQADAKPPAPSSSKRRKTATKTAESKEDEDAASAPKPRSRPKAKSKAKAKATPDAQPDAQPKRSGRTKTRPVATATTETKPKPSTKVVDDALSDDDNTLVETPRKPSNKKRKAAILEVESEDEEETNEHQAADAAKSKGRSKPNNPPKRVKTRAEGTKGSRAKVSKAKGSSGGDDDDTPKTTTKKRPLAGDDDKEDGEDPRPSRPALKKVRLDKPHSTEKKVHIAIPITQESEKPPPARRKKNVTSTRRDIEETDDDRPKKAHVGAGKSSTSEHLKENGSRSTNKPPSESARKPRSRSGTSKGKATGPPPSVLERIKASAAHHRLKHEENEDSEPDPLDCIS